MSRSTYEGDFLERIGEEQAKAMTPEQLLIRFMDYLTANHSYSKRALAAEKERNTLKETLARIHQMAAEDIRRGDYWPTGSIYQIEATAREAIARVLISDVMAEYPPTGAKNHAHIDPGHKMDTPGSRVGGSE